MKEVKKQWDPKGLKVLGIGVVVVIVLLAFAVYGSFKWPEPGVRISGIVKEEGTHTVSQFEMYYYVHVQLDGTNHTLEIRHPDHHYDVGDEFNETVPEGSIHFLE